MKFCMHPMDRVGSWPAALAGLLGLLLAVLPMGAAPAAEAPPPINSLPVPPGPGPKPSTAPAPPPLPAPPKTTSTTQRLFDDVYQVLDDAGQWADVSQGITHQRGPHYWAKKVLDLSGMPEEFWVSAGAVRLSAFCCVRDYSVAELGKSNGLDETLVIEVNGHVHEIPDRDGLPVFHADSIQRSLAWHDFVIPKGELVRGTNEFVFRMTAPTGKKPDDYLYLGIDNTVPTRNSWVRLGEKGDWRQDKLNAVGAQGEYMVRLYLLGGPRDARAVWQPGEDAGGHAAAPRLDDPWRLLDYAGSDGPATRLEWNPERLDSLGTVSVVVETQGDRPFDLQWLGPDGEPVLPVVKVRGPRQEVRLEPPWQLVPSGVQLAKGLPLKQITVTAPKGYHPLTAPLDEAPLIAPPQGKPAERKPRCRVEGDKVTLSNDNLRCELVRRDGHLRLVSLYNELAAAEMARQPDEAALWLVEINGQRYAGSRDFACGTLTPDKERQGFSVCATNEKAGVEAVLEMWIDDDLHAQVEVINRRDKPLDFKLAFPHLTGLAVSPQPEDDYYFYPAGGGIVADSPAVIRQGYGDHQAIYQVMDLFSPKLGAGLAVWTADDDGRYKVLALRKFISGRPQQNLDKPLTPTAPEFQWTNSLPEVAGVGLAYEYLRRTRDPGDGFAARKVVLHAHAGDWHAAMQMYADWCHHVWRFRKLPSRLTPVINMQAAGWGQSPLFRDGAYRTDFITPRTDCIELMSWWEWSPLGPWRTPWDQLEKRLGPAAYQRGKAYFVADPVTGKTMYPINRGDYDGYNQRWGGLPAFRAAIETYRRMGALVTLYTDPLLADDNTQCGQKWGKLWGIVNSDGSYRTAYESWNMCHDVAEYRQYVAQTMGRVMRETGADGIRLDEYGHRGAACFSKLHEHTFAAWGCTEWQRAIAETCKMVHRAMDEVRPDAVLTTEHPGYDYLMQFIDGCITYDLTVQASPLRPAECNLQRFYFPECKAYELDTKRADPKYRKRFWSAVGAFGGIYPAAYDAILRENADVFNSPGAEPLVATLARQIYANRFQGAGKTLYLLDNACGHSHAGPVLELAVGPDQHLVDLLHAGAVRTVDPPVTAAASPKPPAKKPARPMPVEFFLLRGEVGCLAVLPKRLAVQVTAAGVQVAAPQAPAESRLVVCKDDGKPLLDVSFNAQQPLVLNCRAMGLGPRQPALLKLLHDGRLVDAVPLPTE